MANWGEIYSPERFRQPIIFDGLKWGKIQPTDIDAMLELQDKAYAFFEVKSGNKDVPLGQRIALERLVSDTGRGGKRSVAMVVSHEVENPLEPVVLADCLVRELYYSRSRRWVPVNGNQTVGVVLGSFMDMVEQHKNDRGIR